MIAPLAWVDLISSAVIVWPISLVVALLQTRLLRKDGMTRQAWLAALALFLQFGTMFSIFGVAQALYFHGLISIGMEIFIIGLATVCVAATAMHIRHSMPPKAA